MLPEFSHNLFAKSVATVKIQKVENPNPKKVPEMCVLLWSSSLLDSACQSIQKPRLAKKSSHVPLIHAMGEGTGPRLFSIFPVNA